MILPILLPLQVHIQTSAVFITKLGHVILNSCCICLFISVVVVVANLIDYFINDYNNKSSAVYIMHSFFLGFILFALLGVGGVMKNKCGLIFLAFVVWLVLIILWMTLCCILFASWFSVDDLCINRRCPETLWLSDWYWQAFEVIENSTAVNQSSIGNTLLTFKDATERFNFIENIRFNSSTVAVPRLKRNSLYLCGSIVLFVNFMFFFALLGSMTWNYFEALYTLGDQVDNARVTPPAAYVFILPFRQYYESPSQEPPTASTSRKEIVENKKPEAAGIKNSEPSPSGSSKQGPNTKNVS